MSAAIFMLIALALFIIMGVYALVAIWYFILIVAGVVAVTWIVMETIRIYNERNP